MYLGSARDAHDKDSLFQLQIEYVLNCAKEWRNAYPHQFTYFNANFLDVENQNMMDSFDVCFKFIGIIIAKGFFFFK